MHAVKSLSSVYLGQVLGPSHHLYQMLLVLGDPGGRLCGDFSHTGYVQWTPCSVPGHTVPPHYCSWGTGLGHNFQRLVWASGRNSSVLWPYLTLCYQPR